MNEMIPRTIIPYVYWKCPKFYGWMVKIRSLELMLDVIGMCSLVLVSLLV